MSDYGDDFESDNGQDASASEQLTEGHEIIKDIGNELAAFSQNSTHPDSETSSESYSSDQSFESSEAAVSIHGEGESSRMNSDVNDLPAPKNAIVTDDPAPRQASGDASEPMEAGVKAVMKVVKPLSLPIHSDRDEEVATKVRVDLVEEYEKKMADMQLMYDKAKERIDTLTNDVEESQHNLAESNLARVSLEKENQRIKDTCETATSHQQQQQTMLEQTKSQLSEMEEKLSASLRETADLQSKLNAFKEQAAKELSEAQQELERQKKLATSSGDAKVESLKGDLEKAESIRNALDKEMKEQMEALEAEWQQQQEKLLCEAQQHQELVKQEMEAWQQKELTWHQEELSWRQEVETLKQELKATRARCEAEGLVVSPTAATAVPSQASAPDAAESVTGNLPPQADPAAAENQTIALEKLEGKLLLTERSMKQEIHILEEQLRESAKKHGAEIEDLKSQVFTLQQDNNQLRVKYLASQREVHNGRKLAESLQQTIKKEKKEKFDKIELERQLRVTSEKLGKVKRKSGEITARRVDKLKSVWEEEKEVLQAAVDALLRFKKIASAELDNNREHIDKLKQNLSTARADQRHLKKALRKALNGQPIYHSNPEAFEHMLYVGAEEDTELLSSPANSDSHETIGGETKSDDSDPDYVPEEHVGGAAPSAVEADKDSHANENQTEEEGEDEEEEENVGEVGEGEEELQPPLETSLEDSPRIVYQRPKTRSKRPASTSAVIEPSRSESALGESVPPSSRGKMSSSRERERNQGPERAREREDYAEARVLERILRRQQREIDELRQRAEQTRAAENESQILRYEKALLQDLLRETQKERLTMLEDAESAKASLHVASKWREEYSEKNDLLNRSETTVAQLNKALHASKEHVEEVDATASRWKRQFEDATLQHLKESREVMIQSPHIPPISTVKQRPATGSRSHNPRSKRFVESASRKESLPGGTKPTTEELKLRLRMKQTYGATYGAPVRPTSPRPPTSHRQSKRSRAKSASRERARPSSAFH
jgi:hypothetical protein